MNVEQARLFRQAALEEGLIVKYGSQDINTSSRAIEWGVEFFTLDLNQGWMTVANATPERVARLVSLANTMAPGGLQSEGVAILGLARQPQSEDLPGVVNWSRMPIGPTIADWLKQNGISPESLL